MAEFTDPYLDPATGLLRNQVGASTRADLDAVVRIELPTAVAGDVLSSYDGTSIDYAVNLWSRSY